jgi:hypothetical protein
MNFNNGTSIVIEGIHKMKKVIFLLVIAVAGCATKTGVISTSQDNFMILKQGSGFWVSPSTIVAEVTQEAGQHCAYKGKVLEILNIRKEDTGFRPGAFPEAEIHFKCVDKK